MVADPRWLEILKASGWQTAAGAIACGGFLLVARWGWLPPLADWMIILAAFGLLLCGCLAIASFITAALKFFPIQVWMVHWRNVGREKRDAREYIEHMTAEEKAIIAYLLARNQKMFTCASDGGYASTLISRGIVVRALQSGQMFRMDDMPVAIPDHIWDVLVQHKDRFPYAPPREGEVHPWRVPWMLQ